MLTHTSSLNLKVKLLNVQNLILINLSSNLRNMIYQILLCKMQREKPRNKEFVIKLHMQTLNELKLTSSKVHLIMHYTVSR